MGMKSFDFGTAPIDKVKGVLYTHQAYLQLVSSLIPNCLTNPEIKQTMLDFGEWMKSADQDEVRRKAPALIGMFEKAIEGLQGRAATKRPWYEIGYDYYSLCRDKSFSWSTGLRYGWLAVRFDCSVLGVPEDMPYHASIGIGHHAGSGAVEEDFLLRDAFFILLKARRALKRMESAGLEAKGTANADGFRGPLGTLNQNVATYSRLAVFGFYSFVECFVNSVGEDFILRNPTLPAEENDFLRGLKKRRFISIGKKIEKFPRIIRRNGKCPLVLSDPAQLVEPFASFVGLVKTVRDSVTHYGKKKADIWRGPHEWVHMANTACQTCMGVAREFWAACYPGRPQPAYLGQLDEKRHIELAEKRLDLEEKSRWGMGFHGPHAEKKPPEA